MQNPFKKLFEGRFMRQSEESVLGVDVGSSSIKIIQLKKKGGSAVLETYGELALGPYSDLEIGQATNLTSEKLSAALADLLKEANTTTNSGGVSIPFSSSLVTLIQMPAIEEKQLIKMIPIEARKYIPVPIGEVTLDWFIIPESEKKFIDSTVEQDDKKQKVKSIDVLLVAIHNDVLTKYREIVKGANMTVNFFEIEIFSTIRATLIQTLSPVVIFDMGAATTKLYIVEYGIVKASHLINRGSQNITLSLSKSLGMNIAKAEEYKREVGLLGTGDQKNANEAMLLVLDHIFAETNRFVLNYQKKFNKNIGQTILTGGGSVLKGMLDLATKNLNTEVLLADPFSKIETPAFLEQVLKEVGPEFGVAVGIALRKLQETE
ncbi:type IV pilus assembly protein PilM [Patescibacteria group bacterium]|nr:type IV pilus assembly protein PilM [Patescibacteria group bacterium]